MPGDPPVVEFTRPFNAYRAPAAAPADQTIVEFTQSFVAFHASTVTEAPDEVSYAAHALTMPTSTPPARPSNLTTANGSVLPVSPSHADHHLDCPTCAAIHGLAHAAPEHATDSKPVRKYAELLQEIRIAQGGSQIMIAYLMSLAFTNRFDTLDHVERVFYLTALILSVSAMGLLMAPTVFRHLTFRHRTESQIATAVGRCVQSGLALLMCSIVSTLLFGLHAVFWLPLAGSVTAGTLVWFIGLWYLMPLWVRTRPIKQARRHAAPQPKGR
ncbi:MAG TPA: DUF6328 family protein [Actinocrinis sp.]|uniref:DUF6328 family protein n=1 Tax=Actinocrinis sp. TaxID=1920516 RepID=UPI002DDD5C42|nr:DUF6328 family protein [Actinocrinis sp.]HEV2347702.1 DUF6328 family protein [Actinocrinis sp.]